MAAGFTTIAVKDANGTTQNLAVYQDVGGTLYPAPTGTDALGHILGLAATPIDSNLYVAGSAIALGSAVSASSIPMVIASDQTAVATTSVGSVHLTAAPTVTAGAYTTGQVVGGLVSLSGASRVNSGSGLVQTVQVTVKTALTAPYDVLFFDTQPTNSTFTDNSALAVNTADLPFLCGVAHCTDLTSGGTPQILQATNLALPFKLSASATTLYAVIVIRGGQTFASTSAIQLSVVIKQD